MAPRLPHRRLIGQPLPAHSSAATPACPLIPSHPCRHRAADHNARAVAQISLVDEYERVLANLYVKPELPVVSYLTPLTGARVCMRWVNDSSG